jgi:hypothetical protein
MVHLQNSIIQANSHCHLMTFMEKDKVQFHCDGRTALLRGHHPRRRSSAALPISPALIERRYKNKGRVTSPRRPGWEAELPPDARAARPYQRKKICQRYARSRRMSEFGRTPCSAFYFFLSASSLVFACGAARNISFSTEQG